MAPDNDPLLAPETALVHRLRQLEAIPSPTTELEAERNTLRQRVQRHLGEAVYEHAAEAKVRVRWNASGQTQDWKVWVESGQTPHERLPHVMRRHKDALPDGWQQSYTIEQVFHGNPAAGQLSSKRPPTPTSAVICYAVAVIVAIAVLIAVAGSRASSDLTTYIIIGAMPTCALLIAAGSALRRLERIASTVEAMEKATGDDDGRRRG